MNKYLLLTVCCMCTLLSKGQGVISDSIPTLYSLHELITIARENSIASKRAETLRKNAYWQYRTFKSDYNPQLSLSGVLPDFTSSVREVLQDDGTIEYRSVDQSISNAALTISQGIGLTGGEIFATSTVSRFDNFVNDDTRYQGNPVEIGFSQPLFRFNPLKWNKKIEPLRYEESRREYVENMEQVAVETANLFFDLLLAQVSLEIARKNQANNDTLFQIAMGRYNLGTIAENDLLQLELQLLRSRQEVAQARVDLETSTLNLRSYVGLTGNEPLLLKLPDEIPQVEVDEQLALEQALSNRQQAVGFRRRELEAQRDVANARGDNGLNADLFASYGLTNDATTYPGIYEDPLDQQRLRIGFEIPLLDWGRTKSRVKTAEANQELVQFAVEQDRLNFKQEVYAQVKQFQLLRDQLEITRLADEIAQKRYDITKNRYMIGKVDITNLNIALTEKDQAKRQYIQSLRSFWDSYYRLRLLTLYDFRENATLYEQED